MTSLKALRGRIQHDVDPIFATDHRLQLLLLVLAAALATAISLLLPWAGLTTILSILSLLKLKLIDVHMSLGWKWLLCLRAYEIYCRFGTILSSSSRSQWVVSSLSWLLERFWYKVLVFAFLWSVVTFQELLSLPANDWAPVIWHRSFCFGFMLHKLLMTGFLREKSIKRWSIQLVFDTLHFDLLFVKFKLLDAPLPATFLHGLLLNRNFREI